VTPFGRRPHSLKTRLLLIVLVAVAASLALMTLGFNLLLWRGLSHNANTLVRSRAAVEARSLDVANGRIEAAEMPDRWGLESEAWTFVGGREIDGPAVSHGLNLAALRVTATPARVVDVPREHARMYALPVKLDGIRAVVVAGVSMRPYQKTRQLALVGSFALACALLVVVALVTRWGLAAALRPVAEMTADAAAWSVHDADRRFAIDEPYDELGRLAATLDGLLDHVSASLRREQRFSAELSHELRTPLAKICAEAELALRRDRQAGAYREALQTVLANAQTMTRTIDTLVAAQRQESGLARGSADPQAVLDEVAAANGELARRRGLDLAVRSADAKLAVGVEADVALRILQPVVENACQWAAGQVTLGVARRGGEVVFTVDDDGPGVRSDELERIFEPGVRGSAHDGDREFPGAGLGLALSRRLARAASGDVDAEAGGDPGGHFVVRLPTG